jgi:hypothetical protein
MIKVRVLSKCQHCNGEAYLPVGEEIDAKGNTYTRHRPCPICEGTGLAGEWISMADLLVLLEQEKCPHNHTVWEGGFHFSGGEFYDNFKEICSSCGVVLK